MAGTDFNEEIDCGSFFDQFDDLIEFPTDDKCNDFPSIWSSESFSGAGPIFSINNSSTVSDLSAELAVPVPYEDVVHLEWLSNFMDDSFSDGGMTLEQQNSTLKKEPSHNQFKTSSPVSVLESSSSSSSSSSGEKAVVPISSTQLGLQRARSKRPRPAAFNPRSAIQLISPNSSESENFVESDPINQIPKAAAAEHKKKKKVKLSLPLAPPVETNPTHPPAQSVRKCMHCQITKTPQWRAGPMGPKSLCNACGVRFKSGRLFPEYRPAASPTFVPSLHSNSHKKVIEMRSKGGEKSSAVMNAPSVEPELIPNSYPSVGYN
ncbi:GATA transcription factor 8-like [Rhododendron vialii]|uniref:GATA transcription factor 8-like n=1 Tax=Rhododendron vialii TaxID=182163 RepID=UPI00265DAB14|nr:GATA transcription factor 8-like [Rhododendron vialii]XP_058183086.1 GATA transcription factor 8-like [Rhododendron vialii]